jgi:hypothetical protein
MAASSAQHGYVGDLLTKPQETSIGYNRLGTSGLKVSKIILGAMSYGSKDWQEWVLEEHEALPLLEYAYKIGINTWDTVSCYFFPSLFWPSLETKIILLHRLICTPTASPRRSSERPCRRTKSPARVSSS